MLYQYNSGDGNDSIVGFNSASTLSISGGEYSSLTSLSDIIIRVDDGSIVLSGAANLDSVNVIFNPLPVWKLNGTTAAYGTADNILVTVKGVSSTDGLFIDTKNNIVTVSSSALNQSDVTISDGYNLVLSSDVEAPIFAQNPTWITDGTISAYKKAATKEGYTLKDNQIIYTATGSGEALIELGGIRQNSEPTVDDNKIILSDGNFTENISVTVISNSGNYEFELAESIYDASFIGSAGRDTITNNGDDLIINGGAGIDKILNNATNSTVYGGAGNDIVSLSGSNGGNMFVYSAGDGKDRVYNFKANDTIKIADNSSVEAQVSGSDVIFKISNGKITVKEGINLSSGIRIVNSSNDPIANVSGNIYTADGVIKSDTIKLAANLTGGYTADSLSVVDGSQLEEGASLNAGTHGESILGGIGKDTLISGDQEFSFTGGEGNDVFFYNGGTGRITDYSMGGTNGKDKIRIADGLTFRQFDTKTNNLILTYADADNNLNYVTIDGGRGKEITFGTNKAVTNIFNDDGIFDAKGKGVSIGGNSESDKNKDTFEALRGYAKIITINASMANYEIKLTGNKKANLIIAGSEGSTINGGKGKDTLVGGDGRDIFVYEANSGNKLIKNYTYSASGGDVISLGSDAKIDAIEEKGANLVLSVGNNKITIEGGAGNPFKFDDGSEKIAQDNMFISTDGKSASLTSAYTAGNEFVLGEGNSWKNFDAGEGSSAYLITGDTEDNSLVGGKKADSISGGDGTDSIRGGKGNDTLWGGDGDDTFIFYAGDGTDKIMDFDEGDMLQILDKRGLRPAKFKGKYSDKNETLTLNITGGGKIILENISAESTFIINNAEHKISGNKLK